MGSHISLVSYDASGEMRVLGTAKISSRGKVAGTILDFQLAEDLGFPKTKLSFEWNAPRTSFSKIRTINVCDPCSIYQCGKTVRNNVCICCRGH